MTDLLLYAAIFYVLIVYPFAKIWQMRHDMGPGVNGFVLIDD